MAISFMVELKLFKLQGYRRAMLPLGQGNRYNNNYNLLLQAKAAALQIIIIIIEILFLRMMINT